MKENNWQQVSADCRQIVRNNYERFCDLLGSAPLCPVNDDFLGQMCSIPIKTNEPEKLQRHLFEKYRIEVPIMRHENYTFLRFSIQAFNSQYDLDKLYNALTEIISKTDFLQV